MNFNLKKLILGEELLIEDISTNNLPYGTIDVLQNLEIGIVNLLLDYQDGKSGFRRLGSEFTDDLRVNDSMLNETMAAYNTTCKIKRATENKRAIHYLIINKWLPEIQEKELVLITFNKSTIGKYLFDDTQIQLTDIVSSFNNLLDFCSLKKEVVIYLVEILSLEEYSFNESASDGTKSYYKIKKKL